MALADLVKIAGIRWTVEEDFANGKDAVGLDHTQARRQRSWRRHVILAMAALTGSEARRLFQLLTVLLEDLPAALATRRMAFHLQRSAWRRRHQARARWHHCKRRLTDLD